MKKRQSSGYMWPSVGSPHLISLKKKKKKVNGGDENTQILAQQPLWDEGQLREEELKIIFSASCSQRLNISFHTVFLHNKYNFISL